MNFASFISALESSGIEYKKSETMAQHTTFKIGGKADVFVLPCSFDAFCISLKAAKENGVPYFILGRGSNILVSDDGIEGAVISTAALDKVEVFDNCIKCNAGTKLVSVCNTALENSLCGLEFAYGIPGSIGGALYMNAGAYGGEMKDVVSSAKCIDKDGNIIELSVEDMNLSYRNSVFKSNGFVILEVTLNLKKGDKNEIRFKMDDLISRRKSKQPLEYPSAGSTFKRPEGNFAGTLIEKCGLKGTGVGGAFVSKKHAGFVINKENATAKDVLLLVDKIRDTVFEKEKIKLEPEIIFVGRKNI